MCSFRGITPRRMNRSVDGALLPCHQIPAMDGKHPIPLAPGLATGQFKPTVIDDDAGQPSAIAAKVEPRLNGRSG